jgi:predicted O-methyltransferase YrrM
MKNTNVQREEILHKLVNTPRVFNYELNYNNGVNCVKGLIDLCVKYIQPTDTIVEIGSFQGISSQSIALHCSKLYCVDPWAWEAAKQAENIFDNMLKDYPNIHKIKLTSTQASELFTDESIDLVYIDGDHSYNAVMEDIRIWSKKVKKNGYIAGHDTYIEDVRKAVEYSFGKNYEVFSDTSWIVKNQPLT